MPRIILRSPRSKSFRLENVSVPNADGARCERRRHRRRPKAKSAQGVIRDRPETVASPAMSAVPLNRGHRQFEPSGPKSAIFGLMRRSKRHLYSITLSACPGSEGGTARPSALAVLRLTIGSNFVGACTHLGLPYESHRLRAPDRQGSTSEVQQ
jgi:hypothetical protein